MRRALALWLLLFGVYTATLGLHNQGGDAAACSRRSRSSTTATSTCSTSTSSAASARGATTAGRLNEPYGIGFPLLIVPAYAIGGTEAVELFLAAIGALAITLAYALARKAAPDPWALGAAAAIGLSPPCSPSAPPSIPKLTAGAVLAGAAAARRAVGLATGLAPRLPAFSCSARCRGWASASCPPASSSAWSPPRGCGARAGAR